MGTRRWFRRGNEEPPEGVVRIATLRRGVAAGKGGFLSHGVRIP